MENKEENKERVQNKNLVPCKPGETHNPNGRPKGQRNYATIQAEAIVSLGKKKNKTPDQIENELYENGIVRAFNGDYRYYKDVLDRTHGRPVETTKMVHEGGIETITNIAKADISEIAKRVAEELKIKKTHGDTNKGTTS